MDMETLAGSPLCCLRLRNVSPDFGALGNGAGLDRIVGALLTYGLIFSVGLLVVGAATWAVASSAGSWHAASKARVGVMVALGGALLTGAAPALVRWLLKVGASL